MRKKGKKREGSTSDTAAWRGPECRKFREFSMVDVVRLRG